MLSKSQVTSDFSLFNKVAKIQNLFTERKLSSRSVQDSVMDGGVVGIDKVLVVEDENGHKTYTFPLKRTFPTTKIENLVLKRNTDSTFSGVLIQYDVSATDKDLFSNWHSVDLKTKTKIYNINNLSIASQARVQTSYFGCFSMSYEDGMCGEDQHSYGDTSCTFTPTNQPGKQAQPPRILSITAVPGCGNGGGDGTTGSSPATGSFPAGGGEGLTMLFDEYDLTYHNGDITDPAFQFWSKVNQFVQAQPQNVQNLNAEYHYVFYFIHKYFQLNGGLTNPNKVFGADRLQKIATWLYDTSVGTHLDYEQKKNIAIWSVKYLLENPDMTWEGFKNQYLTSPCEKLQKVGKNSITKNAMKNLKTKTNDNKEHAYLLWESNNQIKDDLYFQGLPNQPGITFTFDAGDKFVAFIHSHYDGPNLLSTFSFDDFMTIINLKQYGAIKDESSFVMGVTTGYNTQYYMMIDNPTKFNSFVSRFYENGILNKKEIDKFGEFYELNVSFKKTSSENENSLVNFLELLGTGIKLFKGDSQMENWQSLERSSDGTVIPKNCN